jgi:hypothetical protein
LLRVPLERIQSPTALFEGVIAGLIDGRRTLKHTGVKQDFGLGANDGVFGLKLIETGNGLRFKNDSFPPNHEKREKEIQGCKKKYVIGKIFVKR